MAVVSKRRTCFSDVVLRRRICRCGSPPRWGLLLGCTKLCFDQLRPERWVYNSLSCYTKNLGIRAPAPPANGPKVEGTICRRRPTSLAAKSTNTRSSAGVPKQAWDIDYVCSTRVIQSEFTLFCLCRQRISISRHVMPRLLSLTALFLQCGTSLSTCISLPYTRRPRYVFGSA